ncbi:MAG: hypothetical protein R3A10_04850 [Caldilineaceae bacterium]
MLRKAELVADYRARFANPLCVAAGAATSTTSSSRTRPVHD